MGYFQYAILEESLNALEKLCKSNLCKMKSLFPENRPSDGLGNHNHLISAQYEYEYFKEPK